MSDIINKLTELFGQFPGIGPRQAKRFVYHILRTGNTGAHNLADSIYELSNNVNQCADCYKYFLPSQKNKNGVTKETNVALCEICADPNLDQDILIIVEKDIDLEAMSKAGHYAGRYFILGNLLPILEKEPANKIRINELKQKIKKSPHLREIIIALSANRLGDNTAEYLKEQLKPLVQEKIKISVLGRGLSTGIELEYSDADTLTHALENRR